jgi:hypothetical protein
MVQPKISPCEPGRANPKVSASTIFGMATANLAWRDLHGSLPGHRKGRGHGNASVANRLPTWDCSHKKTAWPTLLSGKQGIHRKTNSGLKPRP